MNIKIIRYWYTLLAVILTLALSGCGKKDSLEEEVPEWAGQEEERGGAEPDEGKYDSAITGESAEDGAVDFETLKKENPDIFAWLYIPGTDIDAPVLQSMEADDYYESHDAYGKENGEGALYIELANLTDMCDFNTVVHGKAGRDGEGIFGGLYRFADPDFFEAHPDMYIYLEGNLLTYTIFAAYERENDSLIRRYDFTYGSGCEKFLADMYQAREMGKNLREGWGEVTPYHFLVTLTAHSPADPERQFVVVGALVGDAAGTIGRMVEW